MRIAAIIPVKTFTKAKSRLKIQDKSKKEFCKLMLEEVLKSVSESKFITETILVSKDQEALEMGKKFNCKEILDGNESGVNNAISLADKYLKNSKFDMSVIFPQDIPFMRPSDIDFILNCDMPNSFVGIVPSRKFDGTNALIRKPSTAIQTHYDEDSYKIHLTTGRNQKLKTSLMLIPGIMMDIDDQNDLDFVLEKNTQHPLCEKIKNLL